MPAVSFSCPKCGKTLKSPQPIPAGKKIKCPACTTIFAMPAQEEELVAAKAQRSAVAARDDEEEEARPRRKAARDDEDEEERPRARKRSRADDEDDEDERPRARKSSRADDEDDEDEDEPRARKRSRSDDEGDIQDRPRSHRRAVPADDDDDEPRRRRSRDDDDDDDRPRLKRRRKSSSGKGLLIGGIALAVVLLLGAGAVGAYFLWFAGVNHGSGKEDPMAYIPPGDHLIVGVKFADLLDDPAFGPALEKSMRDNAAQSGSGDFIEQCKKETGLEFKELFANTIIAIRLDDLTKGAMGGGPGMGNMGGGPGMGNMGGGFGNRGGMQAQVPPGMTMIFQPSKPFDQKKLGKSFAQSKQKSAHGKTYYDVNDGGFRTVFMPSNRMMIASTLSASDLDSLFTSDGKTPSVSPEIASLVHAAEDKTYWAVLPFEGAIKDAMKKGMQQGGGLGGLGGANVPKGGKDPMQAVADAFLKTKGMSMWCDLQPAQVKVGFEVACADNTAASLLVAGTDQAFNDLKDPDKKKQLDNALANINMLSPKMTDLINELRASFQYSAQGATFKMNLSANRTTLTALVKDLQQQMGGGAAAAPPVNFGPPGNGPGFNPGQGGGAPGFNPGGQGNPGGAKPPARGGKR